MASIQAFWFVADWDAERMAISPVQLGASAQAISTRPLPMPAVSA